MQVAIGANDMRIVLRVGLCLCWFICATANQNAGEKGVK
jgi:hypothetical protein